MNILSFSQDIWGKIKGAVYVIQPALFSIIVLILGFIFLAVIPQGRDAVLALSSANFIQQFAFTLAALFWAAQIWYWAKIVYIYRLFRFNGSKHNLKHMKNIPRVLGILAFLVVDYILFRMAPYAVKYTNNYTLYWMGAIFILLTVLFGLFIFRRQRIFKLKGLPDMLNTMELKKPNNERNYPLFSDLIQTTRRILLTLTVASAVLFLLFIIASPVLTFIGGAAVIIVAFSIWVPPGNWILYLSHKIRLPIFSILIILSLLFSLWNDNHHVRVLDKPPLQVELENRMDAFLAKYPLKTEKDNNSEKSEPLYIVATEGGGIRSAFWTAAVLGKIQDNIPQFHEQLFAISSVSGGSLGAAVFTALVKEKESGKNISSFFDKAQEILKDDFLCSAAAMMLTGDMIQPFLFFPIQYFSRGLALEKAWERAWKKVMKDNRFAEALTSLWENDEKCSIPCLFLNGTLVESGQRIIASNIKIYSQIETAKDSPETKSAFLDAVDIYFYTEKKLDMPLSTAVLNSARFPYISPSGTLAGGIHVVDGGYYDNSGTETALEVFSAINEKLAETPRRVRIEVIMISNEPVSRDDSEIENKPIYFTEDILAPLRFASELLSPLIGAFNALMASHPDYSKHFLKKNVEANNGKYYSIVPFQDVLPFPLGWSLSNEVRKKLTDQARDIVDKIWPKLP